MSAPNLKSTEILTDHLGYPAISLLDDIINTVNDIMYKCTAAMEKYLLRKSNVNGGDYSEEIKIGVAKLETLLEHTVDKNFDKLELYTLRNVLRVPQELVDSNTFRLKHQRNLILGDEETIRNSEVELQNRMLQIEHEFKKNQKLQAEIEQLKLLKLQTREFKKLILAYFELEHSNSDQNKQILQSLKPIDDTVKLLTSQLKNLYTDSEENCSLAQVNNILNTKLMDRTRYNSRTKYIDSNVNYIFKDMNTKRVTTTNPRQAVSNNNINIVIEDPDIDALKQII